MIPFFAFALGILFGGLAVWLVLRVRIAAQEQGVAIFKSLAADTLHQNSATFLQMAESKFRQTETSLEQKTTALHAMVQPVKDTLQRMDTQLQALEVKREGAYRELAEMVAASREAQNHLRRETSQLLQALRAPTARGRWGELQLQRILEMTGMSTHARDFSTQTSFAHEEGTLRPDVVVALPGNRCVIIDSKVPLAAYLDAIQSGEDTVREDALKRHAKHVKDHIKRLGAKAYWEQIEGTPEFVVLFLPGEHFLIAALDGDSGLMDYSISQNIVLATPMTLIALLRTVAYGWRQEQQTENVRQIAELGRKLHSALFAFVGQMETLGSRLGGAVDSYNKTIATLEKNILTQARQLADFGAAAPEEILENLSPVEKGVKERPKE